VTVPGELYLVATPIGNLGDITLRALELLRAVDGVICEDTRRTRTLLEAHGIQARLISMPAFDERRRAEGLVERLERGERLALCTDAGSPSVSDPGQALVALAIARAIPVTALPGASAVVAALQLSGLPSDRFLFTGFLPRKGGARREALEELAGIRATLVLFESPRRLRETLTDLVEALGDRRAAVARELTKLHEEVARGKLSELAGHFAGEVRGEVAIVIEGAGEALRTQPEEPLDDAIRRLDGEGLRTRDLARQLATERQVPAREIYARALQILDKD
jgi:16S rRNA (cytidine1402-2'-O)-methyltransferase